MDLAWIFFLICINIVFFGSVFVYKQIVEREKKLQALVERVAKLRKCVEHRSSRIDTLGADIDELKQEIKKRAPSK